VLNSVYTAAKTRANYYEQRAYWAAYYEIANARIREKTC